MGKGFRSDVDERELYSLLAIQAEEFATEDIEIVEGPPGHRLMSRAPESVVASIMTTFPSTIKIPEMAVKAERRRMLRIMREKAERTEPQKFVPCNPT